MKIKRIVSFFTALSMTLMLLTGVPIGVSAVDGDIAINETNFPDEVFRNKVKNSSIDKNTDGKLSADEIADINVLSVDNNRQAEENVIHNLKGIEFFTELTEFYCRYNSVDSLDLSKNTKLTKINCVNSEINSLNVSNCTALSYLDCASNNLTTLDVSNNTELTYLACAGNRLTGLNVRNNTVLTDLVCGNNLITELDISQNTALVSFNCIKNQLTHLDVSKNTALVNFHFYNNKISEVDLSQNTNLNFMMCQNNQLTALDLSKNSALNNLNCSGNLLTELDVSNNHALGTLQCSSNQLTSLNVSSSQALKTLVCKNNTYTVSTCVLDPAKLPGKFDLSKASNWTNAVKTDDNKILSLATGNATYTYNCGNGKTAEFTIVFPSRSCTKVEAKDADCTEDGNIEYYECTDCGSKFKNENPTSGADILSDEDVVIHAVGHTFETDWSKDETNHWHAATCGHDVISDKSAHTWNGGVVTTEPTEETEGVKTYTCTTCKATKNVSVDKLEHTHTYSDTWTSDETNHWHAATCGHDVVSDEAAHTWDEGKITTAPTETAEGEKTFTCTVCKATKTDTVPKLDHVHALEHNAKVEPTCKADGTAEYWHCTKCNKDYSDADGKIQIADKTLAKLGHDWGEGTVTKEPTCTEKGIKTFICQRANCGETKTEDIAANGHTEVTDAAVAATCTTDGKTEGSHCSVCGTVITAQTTIPANGHTEVTDAAVEPTCTTTGKTAGKHCSVCNTVLVEQTDILAKGHAYAENWSKDETNHWHAATCGHDVISDKATHIWGSETVITEPTEAAEGVRTYTCSICTATKTESIPALVHTHTYSTAWASNETHHWHAATCGHDVVSDEAAHIWGSGTVTTEPTEAAEGVRTYTCSICTATKTESIPALVHTHTYSTAWTSSETHHWHAATCGHDVVSDEAAHIWGSGTVTTEPTEAAEGVRTYTCSICTATKTESIPALVHTHTYSTAWASNETHHWHAATCGHNVISDEAAHTWNGGVVTKDASCTEKGVLTYTCTICNMTKTEDIAVTSHIYGTNWVTSDTSHWHECTICGEKADTAIHVWNTGEVIDEAAEDKEGTRLLTCTICSATKTETIPALSHTHEFSDQWSSDETSHWHSAICGHSDQKADLAVHIEDSGTVTIEPTYGSAGVKTFACTVCGYIMRTEEIPQLVEEHVHSFGTDWKYDGTNHWHDCVCGEKSDISVHIPSDWIVVTPATTEQEGLRIKSCTVCNLELERGTIEKLPDVGGNSGDVTEDVRDTAGTNAELVQDNTLIENTLTSEDRAEIENGSSFEIVLEVTDIRDSVSPADAAAVSSALKSGENIGIYVDCSLFKIKDGTERTPIYNTNGQIGITLKIPENIYASDRTYSIIRVHNGTAENLGGTYDKASRELTFYTDRFSTYAIAYAAASVSTDRPSVPTTPSTPTIPSTPPVLPTAPSVTPTVTETTAKEDEVISDEPYVEDVSSGAGVFEDSEDISEKRYTVISIICGIAILGILVMLLKKRMLKK